MPVQVATIDLLWSFAHVSISQSFQSLRLPHSNEIFISAKLWYRVQAPLKECQQTFFLVRPEFTDTLAIKSGRHPVLETVQSAGMVVSNDIYCSDAAHFHIVHGPK